MFDLIISVSRQRSGSTDINLGDITAEMTSERGCGFFRVSTISCEYLMIRIQISQILFIDMSKTQSVSVPGPYFAFD